MLKLRRRSARASRSSPAPLREALPGRPPRVARAMTSLPVRAAATSARARASSRSLADAPPAPPRPWRGAAAASAPAPSSSRASRSAAAPPRARAAASAPTKLSKAYAAADRAGLQGVARARGVRPVRGEGPRAPLRGPRRLPRVEGRRPPPGARARRPPRRARRPTPSPSRAARPGAVGGARRAGCTRRVARDVPGVPAHQQPLARAARDRADAAAAAVDPQRDSRARAQRSGPRDAFATQILDHSCQQEEKARRTMR